MPVARACAPRRDAQPVAADHLARALSSAWPDEGDRAPTPAMVRSLVRRGADPSHVRDGYVPWAAALNRVAPATATAILACGGSPIGPDGLGMPSKLIPHLVHHVFHRRRPTARDRVAVAIHADAYHLVVPDDPVWSRYARRWPVLPTDADRTWASLVAAQGTTLGCPWAMSLLAHVGRA